MARQESFGVWKAEGAPPATKRPFVRLDVRPGGVVAYEDLPVAVEYEPEPYLGCPRCESREWGATNPFVKPLVYRCHECQSMFRIETE